MGVFENLLLSEDLEKLQYHIEYTEMIIDMLSKRNVEDKKTKDELFQLIARYKQLNRATKQETD